MQARTMASTRRAKANRASHGPRVSPQSQAKERVESTMENPKGSSKEPKVRSKVPNAQATVKHRTRVSHVSTTRNQKQARKLRNQCTWERFVPLRCRRSMMNGVLRNGTTARVWMNGMMTGKVFDGMKIANKRTTHL